MEILNNIWSSLVVNNVILTQILYIPLAFIESFIYMLLFTTILNIKSTKKQNIIYILSTSLLGIISSTLIPKPYSNLITLIGLPLIIMHLYKINIIKSILAEFIPMISVVILEVFISKIFYLIFNVSYQSCSSIPIFRIAINLIIYLLLSIIYIIIKHSYSYIEIINNVNSKNKKIVFINVLSLILFLFVQMYLIGYYNNKLPSYIVITNLVVLISYCCISLYSIIKTLKLEKATEYLEQEKLYNKTLQILHDNVRAFKHDFSNIIAGIGGYVETEDISGLKKYYKQLLQDCKQVNNLSSLNPDSINNPAVYAILADKYYKADNYGIKINLECFIDFNKLNMEIYEFTRILGILMDNSIEASRECDKKLINVSIRNDSMRNRQLLTIENTYKDKDINLNQIYEKGFSTKPNNTGLGLWEVNKIISKHNNIARFTSKSGEFFKQQIEIYTK